MNAVYSLCVCALKCRKGFYNTQNAPIRQTAPPLQRLYEICESTEGLWSNMAKFHSALCFTEKTELGNTLSLWINSTNIFCNLRLENNLITRRFVKA